MGKLSAVQIEKWRKAGKSITGKSDGDGLTFTLSNRGTAPWVLRYSFGGKQRELTIGNYPDISFKRAREIAAEKRVEVDRGADVATKKRIAKIDATRVNSFRELAEDYMERAAPSLSSRYRAEIKRFLSKDILPRIGGIPVKEVRPADIVVMTERIAERSTTVAKAAFTMVSAMFDHGVGKHLATENPCRLLRISSIIGRGQAPRQRIGMNDEQLRAFLAALPGLGKENELALKIILATAVRKGELARALGAYRPGCRALAHPPGKPEGETAQAGGSWRLCSPVAAASRRLVPGTSAAGRRISDGHAGKAQNKCEDRQSLDVQPRPIQAAG